jgi:glycosyltransferase involved in cell wall biosynthesis
MRLLVPLPFDLSCQAHGRNLRIVNLLGQLSGRCEIVLAAADETIADGAARVLPGVQVIAPPRAASRDLARAATLHGPWWLRRAAEFFGYDPALHAWIDRLSGDADAVLGFDLVSALYLTQLGRHAARTVPTLCDLIDDPWLTFRSGRWVEQFSAAGAKTAIAVQALRRMLLPRIDMLIAVAPRDAEVLSRTTGRQVRVVPNGVSLPASLPSPADRESLVVFTGAMSFLPNEQAARYLVRAIWPRVRRMVAGSSLALVGADPTPRVRALAEEPGVRVTGRVENMQDWLRRARVATAPMLSGTGLKNKILEAAAQSCPVVATRLAANGIPHGQERGILVADDPASFSTHLVQMLIDPARADRIGRAGSRMVREGFSWPRAADVLWSAVQDCLGISERNARPGERPDRATRRVPRVGKEVTAHAAT